MSKSKQLLVDEKLTLERVFRQLLPANVTPFVTPQQRAIAVFWGPDSQENSIASFTPSEWNALLVLAEFYPHYAPYEVLLARLSATSPDYSRHLIQEAQQRGTVQQIVGPIRYVMKTLRVKLRPFSLTVSSLYGLGSFFSAVSSTPKKENETPQMG